MAQCVDGASLKAAEGSMAIGTFPANMNFDFVKQGNQDAWTFGFAGSKPVATNAFNLEKNQFAGSLFDNSTAEHQASLNFDGAPDLTKVKGVQGIYDSRVVNIEMITAGDQKARAFGAGTANNVVNIKTMQTGCCPTGSCPL
jgi:hypothetical protein